MLRFEIDGKKITDFTSFVSEVNQNFISKLEGNVGWSGNLDAFNDYLAWPASPYCFHIKNSNLVKTALLSEFRDNRAVWPILIEIFKDNSEWVILEMDRP